MDSWTDKQLQTMRTGGNDKLNSYLKSKGVDPRAPIKQKYENDHAALYKEILKARVEGRPEPTSLPPPKNKASSAPSSMNRPMASMGGGDPNGMERLAGETEQQYVARQTRLREEARARMQAKFGGSGGRMGGVGSSGMQGLGSNPSYNPNGGYGGAGLDDVMNGVSSVFSTGLSLVGGAATSVSSIVNDQQTTAQLSNIGTSVTATAGSFWGSLSSAASQVASSITQPDGDDGLDALRREFSQNKPATSKYAGFGSGSQTGVGASAQPRMGNPMPASMAAAPSSGGMLQEAPGLPGEDRNGMERLTGETDEQYVMRQTRLRDEAKARMAAKFGGGGLSSASSSASTYTKPNPAPASGGFSSGLKLSAPAPAPASGSFGGVASAPSSGGFGGTPVRKNSKDSLNSDDFFASFGT